MTEPEDQISTKALVAILLVILIIVVAGGFALNSIIERLSQ